MATDLTGLQVRNTYNSLLKIGDNSNLTGTAKRISDGLGNDSPLFISTSQISIGVAPATGYDLTVNSGIRTGSIDVLGAATAQSLQFTGGSGTQATMSWNTDEETVDLIQNGATLQLGQETHVHVKNQSGATINDGTPVYVTGTLGASGRLTVAPMIADGSIEAKYFLGVTTEDIPNGEDGKVTTFGKIRGLDTTAYTEGQTLYVSSTTAGFWQTTPPAAPALDLEVAIVINVSANNGTLFVRSQNGYYLGMLHDVYLNSVADNQLLVYNATNSRWENQGIASIGSINLQSVTDNGNSTTNEVTIKNTTYSEFGNGNTDINSLLSGSTFGTWIKGRQSGHVVIGLRDNDNNDSFAILSGSGNYTTDSTYDNLLARFEANGNITLGGNTNLSSGALKIGGTTVVDSSRNISANDISAGNMTLSGYLRGAGNFVIDPSPYSDDAGTVQILGNLIVEGETTTINSTTVTIDDKNLVLASGAADANAANGAGITIDGASATMIYNSTSDRFVFNKDIQTGNITTNSITGDSLSIDATTQIDLKYNGSTQLRIDQFGVAYLGTVTFANDGISLTDEDSTTDSFFHANIDYDAGLYQVVSNTRYGSDYIQVDGLDTRDRTRFAFSPKETTTTNPTLYIGGGYSATSPNTLDDWYDININTTTLDISATSVSSNANISAPTFIGDLQGNADTASTWETARTITIGDTGKSVNGSGNVSWSRTEIGITKSNIDALNIDANSINGFYSVDLCRNVFTDSFGDTPDTRYYVITLPFIGGTGGSQYYYFDVLGFRDIGNYSSQLHYRVYLHSRAASTNNNILDADVITELEQASEFFTFAKKDGGSSSSQFYIKTAEDYSGIQIIAYPSGNDLTGNMIASQDTEPTGFSAVTPIKQSNQLTLQDVTDVGSSTTNTITASGGINGLTLTNGISGTNFNITGVNQLEIADPGEGIVFKSGSSGDMVLSIVDDASDNRLDFSGTNAAISVNSALLATQSWVQSGIETASLLIDSGGSDTPLGKKYIYRIGNSSSDGSTWKKVCDVNIPTGLFAAVSMDIVFNYPNTNYGDSASLTKYHYSASFRRSHSTQDSYNDAVLYGYNSNYIRIVKTATGDYELQTRANTNNRGIFIEYVITGGNPDWITPTTSVVNGSTSGTIYAASVNTTFKTLTGGSISANEFEVNANLLVDSSRNIYIPDGGKLNLGNSSDSTIYHNGSNAYFDSATGSMFIRNFANDSDIVLASDDGSGGIDDYIRIDGSEGSVILYHYGDQKLVTTATGVSVTGALSGNISTSSISGGTIDINGTTAINLQYNGTTQLRIDSNGVDYLGTVSFSNDGISLTDEDSTIDSFFHANVDYDAGLYTVTSNARYGADYIQVDGLDSRDEVRFTISPKDIGDPDPHAYLYIGGDNSTTSPNTLVDWHTIEMNALSVQINGNEVATQTWVNTNTLNQTEGDNRYLQLSGGDMTGNITFGQGGRINFPDNSSIPDSPTNEQVDYVRFGSQGSISQVSGRGALMITSSDDSLVLANGDVGRFFTSSEISVAGETTYLLSDGNIEMYSDLQDGWDGAPTPWYRLRYGGNVLSTYDGTNTYTYWNSNDDAIYNSLRIGGTTVIDSSRNIDAGTISASGVIRSDANTNSDFLALRLQNAYDDDIATSNPSVSIQLFAASNNGYLRVHGAPADTASKHQIDLGSTAGGSFVTLSPASTEVLRATSTGVSITGDLTVDSDITGSSFIKSGGTSSQFLKADGSVDSSTYLTTESDTLQSVTNRGASTTNAITITNDNALLLRTQTAGVGAKINFSDQSTALQNGTLRYVYVDTASYGSGNAFIFESTEPSLTVLADGKLMYAEGIYSKPASGTGGGTRKDANWDSAYTFTSTFDITDYTDPKYLRSDTSDTMTGNLTLNGQLTIKTAAAPIIFNETGHTGDGQWWRHVLDSGNMRWDVSTSGGSGFTTYDTPIRMLSDGNVYMQNGVSIGTTSTRIGGLTVNAEDDKSRIIISRGGTTLTPSTSIGALEYYADYNNSPIQYATIEAYANGLSGVRSSLDFNVKSTSGNILTGMTVYGTSSGVNIGVGTTTPSAKLQIGNGAASNLLFHSYDQYNEVKFYGVNDQSGNGVWEFINDGTWNQTRFYVQDANNLDSRLTFRFTGANGANEILSGTSSGKIGIGTTSPSSQLHISNVNSAYLRLENQNDNYLLLGAVGGSNRIYSRTPANAAYPFSIEVGTDAVFNIDTSSRVGIGVTSPTNKLDVNGTVRGRGGFTSDNNAKEYFWTINNTGNSGTIWKKIGTYNSAGQSSRIMITAVGTNSYGAGTPGGKTTIIAQVNNNNLLEGTFWQEGMVTQYGGVRFVSTSNSNHDIFYQVSSYSEWALEALVSDGTFTPSDSTVSAPTATHTPSREWNVNAYLWVVGGDVGIGDSSPSEKLDVAGKIRTTGRNYSYGQLNHHIELAEDSGSGYIGNINRAIYMSNGSYFGAQIYNVDSTQTGLSTIFLAANGDTSLLNDTFTAGVTTKQGSTRMIVKGDTGRVGIGTISPAVQLSVTGTIYASGGSAWNGGGTEGDKTDAGLIINEGNYIYTRDGSQYLRRLIGKNTSDVITIGDAGTSLIDAVYFYSGSSCSYRWHNNTSVVMELNSTGLQIGNTNTTYALDVTGTIRASGDVIAYSDARVKENVKTIDNALDKVTQLRGVSYNKIGETEEKIGVIAQEIEKVLPQVVQEDNEGMKSVAYGNIVGVLIEAIKEQQKQIDELKAIINGGS